MSTTSRSRRSGDAGLLWLACILALGLGYYVAFARFQEAIDRQHDRTADLWSVARTQRLVRAQRPALESAERSIAASIAALQLGADRPTTVARFIRSAARIATAGRVTLVAIEETHAPAGTPAQRTSASSPPFESIPLDVTLAGNYRDLIAAIAALARAPLAMQIDIAAIERAARPDDGWGDAVLTAHLHVVLQRLTDGASVTSDLRSIPEDTTNHARSF